MSRYLRSGLSNYKSDGVARLIIEDTRNVFTRTLFWWPDKTINSLIRGVGWAQEELATIPWEAREQLIQALIDRGEKICHKYSLEERIVRVPMQMIRSRVT